MAVEGSSPKEIVAAGYDKCGPRYNATRACEAGPQLRRLLDLLPRGGNLLEIGCGGGQPVTKALAKLGTVTGVDISSVQIGQARRRLPGIRFIVGDIMAQQFQPSSFDAVVSVYTFFHLPREEHRALLERIAGWLRPGGFLLATVADFDHAGYTELDFFGATMYWSHFGPEWYVSVLQELGFVILEFGALDSGYRDSPGLTTERHPVLLARTCRVDD